MENCFICYKNIDKDCIYVPREEEYFGEHISVFKNTFIIKSIDNYQFLYLNICNKCLEKYINLFGKKFQYVKNREIGKKI